VYDRAEWCLKEALRIDAAYPMLRARLATVLAATGRQQRAAHLFLQELRDDPGNIQTLLDYAALLAELDRVAEASEKLRRVLELEPANIPAHALLGHIALQSGRIEQAHLEFELVLKLDSSHAGIRTSLGESLLRLGRDDEARAVLMEELGVIEGDGPPNAAPQPPQCAAARIQAIARLGGLLLQAGEAAEAAKLFAQAASLADRSESLVATRSDLYRQLALARFKCGDRTGGCSASRRVLRLQPACLASMHNLALAALHESRLRVAAGWIARGLRISPHDDGLRRLRIRLWFAMLRKSARRGPLRSAR